MNYPTLHVSSRRATTKLPIPRSTRLLLGTIAIGLTGVFGCATQVDGTGGNAIGGSGPGSTTGSTNATMATNSTTGSGTGGTGGMSLCAMDCSTIDTPECLKAVCNDGSFIGPIGQCVVVGDLGATCDDGLFCTLDDACTADGTCVGETPNDCNLTPGECEKVACDEDDDACDLVGMYPANVPCTDGSECPSDSCTNGVCDAPLCTPTDLCVVGQGTCAPSGQCVGTPKDCAFSPLAACNTVACNPTNGKCEGVPDPAKNGNTCNGGDQCFNAKTCLDGACQGGTAKDCSAFATDCTVPTCNSMSGACGSMPIPAGGMCAAATDSCNQGVCNATGMCVPMPFMDGTQCGDTSLCTSSDHCVAGTCTGTLAPGGCQNFYYAESFANCATSQWTFGGDWQCGVPTNVGPANLNANNVVGTVLSGNYNNGQAYATATATSPVIAVPSNPYNPVKLYFYLYVDTEGSSYDAANLRIKVDNGTFDLVGAGSPCTPANGCAPITISKPYNLTVGGQAGWGGHEGPSGWQLVTADLTPYEGHNIQLRFSFRTDTSGVYPGVYFDDVTVALSPDAIPLGILTGKVPTVVVNSNLSQTITKLGGPATASWSIVPGGVNDGWLSIDPTTGQLTGTPSAANVGQVTVTVKVADPNNAQNTDQKTFTFNVIQPATLPFNEGFESPCPGNWTLTGAWQCGTPSVVGPPSAFAGTQCLGTILNGDYNPDNTWAGTTATSPPISLVGSVAPTLTWRAWVESEGSTYDGYNLRVSTDGVNFTLLTSVTPAYSLTIDGQQAWGGTMPSWQTYTANLSAYAGQTIYIRWAFRSDFIVQDPGVYIDAVSITP